MFLLRNAVAFNQNITLAARSFATLKDIQLRLKSIQNIGKITKSMKMIASTKLNRAQKTMEVGRAFARTSQAFVDSITAKEEKQAEKNIKENDIAGKELLIVCSSDRGLCGAIHSSLSKLTKRIARAKPEDVQIAIIGDKAKPQIAREARKNIILSFSQVGKNNSNYSEAALLATEILKSITATDVLKIRILYNKFQTVISYENSALYLKTPKAIKESPRIAAYAEEEPMSDETLQNFFEFNLANMLYWGLVEGHASEMASRRMAMENATKNSEQIVQALTMRYNRTRQAVITNELVDIITGASAL